jgi:hypothetical protein
VGYLFLEFPLAAEQPALWFGRGRRGRLWSSGRWRRWGRRRWRCCRRRLGLIGPLGPVPPAKERRSLGVLVPALGNGLSRHRVTLPVEVTPMLARAAPSRSYSQPMGIEELSAGRRATLNPRREIGFFNLVLMAPRPHARTVAT